jgi:uncharacterized protein (DUF1697 family)
VPQAATTHVILLRAIGPITHALMKMDQWREAAQRAGFDAVETLLSTGNMIADFRGTRAAAGRAMDGVLRGFGLPASVVAIFRSPRAVRGLVKAAPLGDAATVRPSQTGIFFFAGRKPDFSWLNEHDGPERVYVVGDHLMVDFTHEVTKSARLIRQIDRRCGLNTARNWNTVRKLAERCAARQQAG